jgi:hypothetical protein
MKTSSRPSKYVQPYARRWSIALVAVCGLTLGYFMLRTFVSPLPRQYQLNFGDAQWIEPPEFAPVAYFRKEIFLGAAPELAWLEVAATDNFKVIINGHNIGSEIALKSRVAGIYDIKGRLKPGTNVIAVSISRTSYPGSAQLLVYGAVKEPGGKAVSLISDEHWRVTPKTGIVEGSEEWNSPLVQEELWPNARRATIMEHPVHISWVDTNPLLLQLPPAGNWILAEDARRGAIFSTSVNAERARQETWIQVASSGDLDLLVNGELVTTAATSPLSEKRVPHLPPVSVEAPQNSEATHSPTVSTSITSSPEAHLPTISSSLNSSSERAALEAYDISYWIKKGPNSIVAAVRSGHLPASILADGFLVRKDASIQRFNTDSTWQVADQSSSHQTAKSHRAVESGRNGSAPWGYLPQNLARPVDHFDFAAAPKICAVILSAILATVAVWLLASWLVAIVRGEPLQYAISRDALFHAPITVGLLFLLLPGYDFRFPKDWPFQPKFLAGAIIALVVFRLLHFFVNRRATEHFQARIAQIKKAFFGDALPYLVLVAIMGLGLALRYHNLDYMSFDHDEMGLVMKSKGIFKLGFPYSEYAGSIRPLTTYELVPYPEALSAFIFGYSEWSMRLPACLMGTLCIGIVALMGRQLFDWRTGLIAGLVYACIPLNIRWAQNAFYLQQCQFFAMLTFSRFYEAIKVRPLNNTYLTAASVAFCATYLSWEGSGFILPALFVGLLVVRRSEWWWLKEFHLYRCLFFIAAVVIAQYCLRTIAGFPYLQVGSGLSNLTGPSLFFLTPQYQPTYYVDKLWLVEDHVFFTVMVAAGIPFCWGQRGFRYVVTVLVALFVCHTNFLAALSPRYSYYFQPLLVLAGIAAAVMLYDRLVSLAQHEGNSTIARRFAHGTGLAVAALLFVQSNEWFMKLYSLSSTGDAAPGLMARMNTYRYDYRGAAQYVKSHFQQGDLIIPGIPHVFEYYAGMTGDYFLDTLLGSKVPYNEKLPEPRFVDKFRGYPAIRSLTELREVTHRGRRTWIIFAPYSSFEKMSSPDVLEYLDQNAKVVFESYRAKVLLIRGVNQPPVVAKSPAG